MKNGKFSPKVHKLKKLIMMKGTQTFSKKHPFKAGMSTRKLYAGEHLVELQINGEVYERVRFELVK